MRHYAGVEGGGEHVVLGRRASGLHLRADIVRQPCKVVTSLAHSGRKEPGEWKNGRTGQRGNGITRQRDKDNGTTENSAFFGSRAVVTQ